MGTALRRSLEIGLALGAASLLVRLGVSTDWLPASGPALEGCSVTTIDGGVILKTQNKYQGTAVTAHEANAFAGQAIHIGNQNGNMVVNGDPNATSISVSAKPFAFADNQTDGSAAITDVQATIKIDESQAGVVTITCGQASAQHGSAGTGTTGCDDFTVTVPAGTAAAPLVLVAIASNGSLGATGLVLSDASPGSLTSDNGDVTVSVSGSAVINAQNGTLSATVAPNKGSTISLTDGNGDVTLGLPAAFTCDSLSLQAQGTGSTVTVASGFTNPFTATSTSVGAAGTGAASLKVVAQFGNIALQPH
jgi:hypothetical protein